LRPEALAVPFPRLVFHWRRFWCCFWFNLSLRRPQPRQRGDQFLIVSFALVSHRINAVQHLPQRVHHGQQCRGDFRIQSQLPVAQHRQQAFPGMRQSFQLGKPQESACISLILFLSGPYICAGLRPKTRVHRSRKIAARCFSVIKIGFQFRRPRPASVQPSRPIRGWGSCSGGSIPPAGA
jgi:hypothetical protein